MVLPNAPELTAIDEAIQVVDRRMLVARWNAAPPRTWERLVAERNALAQQWGREIQRLRGRA